MIIVFSLTMEKANKLSRKAIEYEREDNWEEAAKVHRQAAQAYKEVDTFEYDPVATLALSSLVQKHIRWASDCTHEQDRRLLFKEKFVNGGESTDPSKEDILTEQKTRAEVGDNDQQSEEKEFEDFWQYMQNWLANPTAFTRPSLPSQSHTVTTPGGLPADSRNSSARSIMESFYLVGSDPEHSSSVYGLPATATPKSITPLQVLEEVDEEDGDEQQNSGDDEGGSRSKEALLAENQRLKTIVQLLTERIRTLESAAQENSMLKNSIHNFREEFHRHANVVSLPRFHELAPGSRRIGSTMLPTHGSGVNRLASDPQAVRLLESQMQSLQLENSKQVSCVAASAMYFLYCIC